MHIKTHYIHWSFLAMLLMAVVSSTVIAQPAGNRKPPPPTVPYELTQETVNKLKNAWNRQYNPSVIIAVGVIDGNTITFDKKDEAVTRLESVIRGELARAFNNVVDLETARKHDDRILASMKRSAGTDIAPDMDKLLASHFDAELQIEVLLRQRNGKLYTESYAFRDLVASAYLGNGTLNRNGDVLTITGADRVTGTFVCNEYAEVFCNRDSTRTFSIRALAQDSKQDKTERTLRRLARDIENELPNDVKWAKVETEVQDGVVYANFSVRYDGLFNDLLFDIEDYVLEDKDMGWSIIIQTPSDAGVYLFKAERPMWHILTDLEDSIAVDATRKRKASLRGKRLGIVVGNDIANPEGYFAINNQPDPSSKKWENAALRASLVNALGDLGLTVQADDSIRKRLDTLHNNAERYNNAPHMIEALGDLSSLDYLLHVNIDNSEVGSPRMIARLYNPGDAAETAMQIWPAPIANRLSEYAVDVQNPEDLARFLAGRLVERWDRKRDDDFGTTLVHVRNVERAESVLGLSNLLRDSVRGIHEVTDIQISGPAASFEIVHEGDTDQMLFSAIDRIGLTYPGVEIQILNGVLVVNMWPETKFKEQLIAIREARYQQSDEMIQAYQANEIDSPSQGDQSKTEFREHLRVASSSVYMVGLLVDSEFVMVGTGWACSPTQLATNAHVVIRIFDLADKYLNPKKDDDVRVEDVHVAAVGPEGGEPLILNDSMQYHTKFNNAVKQNDRMDELLKVKAKENAKETYMENKKNDNNNDNNNDKNNGENNGENNDNNNGENKLTDEELTYIKDILEPIEMFQLKLNRAFPVKAGDVGLLTLKGSATVQPLQLASASEVLQSPLPPDEIAYIGYPAENARKTLLKGDKLKFAWQVPQQIGIGTLMALTSFDSEPADVGSRQLLHYDLVTAKGASGSPVFSSDGKVIALHSTGSYVFLDPYKAGATSSQIRTGFSYGQRIDLLHDLLQGRFVATMPVSKLR